jgi:hypothetical protein
LNNCNRVNCSRDEGCEVLKGVTDAADYDDPKLSFGEILLKLEVPIARHEDRETRGFGCVE